MKKLILFLLLPLLALAQNPTNFPYGIKNTGASTSSAHTYVVSQGTNGVYTKTESVMNQNANSGILSGGGLSVNADPTKYDIAAGEGYVSNTLSGTVSKVTWATATAQTTPYLLTAVATYVLKDNTGATVLQTTAPTPQQYRTHIYLGKLAHTTFTTILFAVSEPSRMFNVSGDLHDLVSSFGSINRSGNTISPNGANLQINVSAGETLREGANYLTNRNSPNITTELAVNATSFRNKFRNGTGGWNAVNTTTVDPNYYDDGTGILALVPNNKFTVKVVYRFGGTGTIHMDYGQVIYDDMDSADRGISAAVSSDPDTRNFASRIGWIIVKQATTSLLDATKYKFVPADKIGERSAGTSLPTDLQDAYNNSLTPQITTSTGLGAVALKRGSAADTDNVLVVQNGSGSDTFSVKGNGDTSVFGLLSGVNGNFSSSITANQFVKSGGTSSQFLKADGSVDSNVYATNSSVVHLSGTETISGNKTFTGQNTFTSASSSTAITVTASTSGNGITVNNNSNGNGFTVNNNSTGVGEIINSATASTSDLTRWQKNGTTTSKVDHNGNITGVSFIKSGGLSSEYLKADGSVSTLTNPITGTLTSGYIPKATGTNSLGNSLIYDNGTNVGIGTTSPVEKFVVSNSGAQGIEFSPNIATNESRILAYDRVSSIYNSLRLDGFDHRIYTSGTEKMRITSAGNVLINTTTDDGVNKLQVNGSAKFGGALEVIGTTKGVATESFRGINDDSYISFFNTANTVRTGYFQMSAANAANLIVEVNQPLILGTNALERVKIESSGVVKINNLAGTGTRMVTADSSGNLAASTIVTSATYTPTLTNTSNISSSSLNQATYTRIGNIINVNVSVATTVSATATPSVLTLTLPINTADTTQTGVGVGNLTAGDSTVNAAGIVGVISASTAEFVFYPTGSGSGTSAISFQYNLN